MRSVLSMVITAALICCVVPVKAETAATSGAKLGEWTQDYDAAVKLAKEKNTPVFLNFSGSDWCGWCKLMTKNVFSKKEWQDYASENIALVLVDFPKKKDLVPEEFVERNKKLKDKYGVRGFPTFVIIDPGTENEIGRLGASRDATPESFMADLSKQLRYCASEVEKFVAGLKEEDKKAYLAIIGELNDCQGGIADAKKAIADAENAIEKLEEDTEDIKAKAAEFRAGLKGPEELKKYKELKAEFDSSVKELEEWFSKNPKRDKEGMEKMQSMKKKLQNLAGQLSSY